jgi:hypothetical protein
MTEWISVKDSLPDYSIDVLVTDGKKIQVGSRFMLGKGEFFLPDYREDFSEITHWTPLPPPPKPNEDL